MIDLKRKANDIRNKVFEMCLCSGGHLASSFSCLDILVSLYHGGILRVDPKNPKWRERDRFILSKGHGETVFYAVLADMGFFPEELIRSSYRRGSCFLGGHPDKYIPGVEVTTGALGHGLGIACGLSLAAKMDDQKHIQFVLMGDSECTEGSVWEAAMFASKYALDNVIAIVDRNRIGSIDFTENFATLEPFADKWNAFGWDVHICKGHDFDDIANALHSARTSVSRKPQLVIAETIKGKGISFVENNPAWHARSVSGDDEIQRAKQELEWREDGM